MLIDRYSFYMGPGAITCSLKKQYNCCTEAGYITQTHMVKEAMYLHIFVQEICRFDKPVMLNCDNQGAIMLSKDNKFHAWTKHINL